MSVIKKLDHLDLAILHPHSLFREAIHSRIMFLVDMAELDKFKLVQQYAHSSHPTIQQRRLQPTFAQTPINNNLGVAIDLQIPNMLYTGKKENQPQTWCSP